MLKRTWFIWVFVLLVGILTSFYFLKSEMKFATVISSFISLAFLFLGISIHTIKTKKSNLKKLKSVYLIISLSFLVIGFLSKYFQFTGSNIEVTLAVLIYCFIYAPIELYFKNEKWRVYSNNSWEILILSLLDFLGVNLVVLGLLSKVMAWPGHDYILYSGFGFLLLGLISWNIRFKQEVIRRKSSEDKIKLQFTEIEKEKQISDNLLLNILPAEVAAELKAKGSADAKQYDEVTILFTDFKDFTKLSEKMSAKELLDEVNSCFMVFDQIIESHGIEKIKTIGDSYMCAGGLPVANKTHAEDVVSASLEIQKFIETRVAERRLLGKETFQIRIGIHTGPVVAGIVGLKKFAYDIWGDAVNTASRMESAGEVGKVNISGTTYELVKNKFNCVHRGKIQAKGKGEIDMYFVEGRI